MHIRWLGIVLLLCGTAAATSDIARAEPTFEPSHDRTGGDYRSLELPRPRPRLCQDACLRDERCKAWVFVQPGILGPLASCWFPAASRTLNRAE